ncbi:methyltransferase [Salmonella enterica subsp. enterica]|nr:methyltransferase [Salmonella enterica subsp. enterica serovar Reading]MLO25853.1 methyltransferase [Salmonella enterica subsp. enterica serovar Reading]
MKNNKINLIVPLINTHVNYIRQFIHSPKTFGTLAPSSHWLCDKMIDLVNLDSAVTVAELGGGDGVFSRRLLKKLSPSSELDVYEIQPELICSLKKIARQHSQMRVIPGSAEHLLRCYDIVFSCLPLLSIPIKQRLSILREVNSHLKPNGVLVQFQYSRMSEKILSRYFRWSREYEVRNFPPAWIYTCYPLHDGGKN